MSFEVVFYENIPHKGEKIVVNLVIIGGIGGLTVGVAIGKKSRTRGKQGIRARKRLVSEMRKIKARRQRKPL